MVRHTTVLAAIAGLIATSELAHAQPVTPKALREVTASGVLMQPQGDFQPALRTIGIGGGLQVLVPVGSGPLAVGSDGQVLIYSTARDQTNPDMIMTVHGLVRLRRPTGLRRPYAEAFAGIKGFSTESRIGPSSYGVGAGMQFAFRRGSRAEKTEQEFVEIGVRYLRGGGAYVGSGRSTSSTHSIMLHVGIVSHN